MTPAIELDNLTRVFGSVRAVDEVSLQVPQGSIFGFLGPNGAGKSTTLGILTGLDFPTSGTARILGHDIVQEGPTVRQLTGVLPDVPGFYPWMKATQVLELAGQLFGLTPAVIRERTQIVLDLAGLTGVTTPVGGFSRGMKQRLGIAQALINAPRVLLLDEPTSALDPLGRRDLLDIIGALAGRTTVFFSSHILSDVERVCDRIAIIDKGKIRLESTISDLRRTATSQRITIELGSPDQAATLASRLARISWAIQVEVHVRSVELVAVDLPEAQREIPRIIAEGGLHLIRFETAEQSLEDIFVDLVRPVTA
jgi:ABC-2 type transport system ATP-binding protein